jgi:pyruvate kinase
MMSSRVNNSDGTDDNEAAAAAAVTTAAAELVESIHMLLDKNGSAIIKLKLENKTKQNFREKN